MFSSGAMCGEDLITIAKAEWIEMRVKIVKDLQDVYVRKRKCKGDERFKEWKGCLIAGATFGIKDFLNMNGAVSLIELCNEKKSTKK